MPNQSKTSNIAVAASRQDTAVQKQASQALGEMYKINNNYYSCLLEIKNLHKLVLRFIENEVNPDFKEATQQSYTALLTDTLLLDHWMNTIDQWNDAIDEATEHDDLGGMVRAVYNDYEKLEADAQHFINAAKIATDDTIGINPNLATTFDIGMMQLVIDTIKRLATQLKSDVFYETDVLKPIYPDLFIAGV